MGHSWGLIGALACCFAQWGGGFMCINASKMAEMKFILFKLNGCLPFTQNFRKFPDFILGNFEMVRMRSICLVPECTRLVPRVSALSPFPQALFSTSNAVRLCRELLCNFLEYIFLCGLSDSEQMFVVEPC